MLALIGVILCVLAAFHVSFAGVDLFPLGVAFIGAQLVIGSPIIRDRINI